MLWLSQRKNTDQGRAGTGWDVNMPAHDKGVSFFQLFVMQKNTDNANGYVLLKVKNAWYFQFPLRSRCTHVLLERKRKLLHNPSWHYLLKFNKRRTRTRYEICSKSRGKTTEQYHWRCSGTLIVNFKLVLHLVLSFSLLTLSM